MRCCSQDKKISIGGEIVPPDRYLPYIEAFLHARPNATLFVATDSTEFVLWFRLRYGTRLIVRDAQRRPGNVFLDTSVSAYKKGHDVLLDALLLSRCDSLLKSSSSVGEFAIYFNMSLHAHSLDLQFEQHYAHGNHSWQPGIWGSYLSAPSTVSLPLACLQSDFMLRHREWLPSWRSWPTGCSTLGGAARTTQIALHQRLSDLHRKTGMKAAFTTNLLPAGFFSTLHGALKPLAHAFREGKALLTPTLPAFTAPDCMSRDLACFFQPLGARAERQDALDLTDRLFVRSESYNLHGEDVIPSEFRGRGWFWWTSQLLSWLMRPSPLLGQEFQVALEETGLAKALREGPVIGLHVRRGDACLKRERKRMGRECHSLDEHLARVAQYAANHGVKTVYLATDDQQIIDEARRRADYRFLWMSNVERLRKRPLRILDRTVALRVRENATRLSQQDAWRATIEVMLLAKCQVLVGQMSSTFFRTAISLRAAECDCAMPFVSLDAPFCFDYGVRSGMNWNTNTTFWC